MPFDIGPWEVVILLAVLAALFGSKGVPDVARRLGSGVRELKESLGEVDPRRMLEPEEKDRAKPTETRRKPDA